MGEFDSPRTLAAMRLMLFQSGMKTGVGMINHGGRDLLDPFVVRLSRASLCCDTAWFERHSSRLGSAGWYLARPLVSPPARGCLERTRHGLAARSLAPIAPPAEAAGERLSG